MTEFFLTRVSKPWTPGLTNRDLNNLISIVTEENTISLLSNGFLDIEFPDLLPVGKYILFLDVVQKAGVMSSPSFELHLEKKPSLYDQNFIPEISGSRKVLEIEEEREEDLTIEFLISDINLDDGIDFSELLMNGTSVSNDSPI